MSLPPQHDAAPSEYYSNLETVYHSPNAPPKVDTGPQVHYYNGDDGSAAKEVYHTEAYNVDSANGGWKKRRICGMPMIVFIAMIALILVSGIVGGVVGGVVGTKKSDSNPPPVPMTTTAVGPTSTVVIATDATVVDTSSIASPSSTDPSAPYPTPDLPSNWWHSIENYNLDATGPSVLTNIFKAGLGGNLKTKNYLETVDEFGDQYYQHWQFYAIAPSHEDSDIVRGNPEGPKMLYRIAARNPGQETLLVLNNDDYMGWNKGTNTSSVDIRLDMIPDQTNDGRFWHLERIPGEADGYWIYNYKSGKEWWLVAEASTELGNEGIVYMTSEDKGSARWFMVKKEFIKPEYNWVV